MQKKGVQGCSGAVAHLIWHFKLRCPPLSRHAFICFFAILLPHCLFLYSGVEGRRYNNNVKGTCLFLNDNLLFVLSVTLIHILSILQLSNVKSFGSYYRIFQSFKLSLYAI